MLPVRRRRSGYLCTTRIQALQLLLIRAHYYYIIVVIVDAVIGGESKSRRLIMENALHLRVMYNIILLLLLL